MSRNEGEPSVGLAGAGYGRSGDGQNPVFQGRRARTPLETLATFSLDQLLAQWSLRGDQDDFFAVMLDFKSALALEIVNRPSDPAGERAVGDALAIVRDCRR